MSTMIRSRYIIVKKATQNVKPQGKTTTTKKTES